MRQSERIAWLLFRYTRDELSAEENHELSEWRSLSPENEEIFKKETNPDYIRDEMKEMYANKNAVFQKITEKYPELSDNSRPYLKFRLMPVAATLIITLGITALFVLQTKSKKEKSIQQSSFGIHSIKPGGNHATLTLANGSVVSLDSAASGIIGAEGSSNIIKKDSGQLVYSNNGSDAISEISYNTLRTPRGGQYKLILPDGTNVWLNAASSLKYPSSFNSKERKVVLEGEAYFEVSKVTDPPANKKVPFLVSIQGKPDVEVLGTHFNIMAYPDEPFVLTTLLEGSVKIGSSVLVPGQQAQENNNSSSVTVINAVDLNEVIAWKNGKTSFKNANIQQIMRAISRWYDVDVEYKGIIPDKKYKGGLPRNTDLNELLEVLNQNGIHFTVEGKKIIVTP